MQTNFFSVLSSLEAKGDWTMHINQQENGEMTVSILFKKPCGDKAAKMIPPFVFTEKTAIALDNMFFTDLAEASSKANEVLTNMEHYLKELERANKASAKEQKNVTNSKSPVQKLSKYEEALNLVDELEKKGKYEEAWMKVPDPSKFPENAEFLRKRREELSRHFAPDLFGDLTDNAKAASETEPDIADEEILEESESADLSDQDSEQAEDEDEEDDDAEEDNLPF